ncbi:MAG TPA: chitobiase/beta-hexosaminidase C-terminal domain-containing protein [Gemmatimonadaceae bacterium]|nr:chitobiase/beta-hexosaminidase C-terminal domain-containing protein [Gemmatimonadaceae bacterium]
MELTLEVPVKRMAAFVLSLGLVGVSTAHAQAMNGLMMQSYNMQLQGMQNFYQAQSPFGVFAPRQAFSEMSANAKSLDNSGGITAESHGIPRTKIEDESERMAPTPTFSLQSGSYDGAIKITISDAAPDAVIYYTLDGSKPQWDSPVYTGPITVSKSAHLVAIAIPPHRLRSAPATASYDVKQREIF